MATVADLYTEIDALVVAKLREQSEAHADIAATLAKRAAGASGSVLKRAHVHAETARRYQLLAGLVSDGLLDRLVGTDDFAKLIGASL